ncbi:hypothetical protein [Ekhidna sp.]
MKILTILGIALTLLVQVPRKVENSFNRKFPSVKNALWSFEDDNYHLSFEHFGQQKTAIFRYNGEWVKTLVTIELSELMFCIRDHLRLKHKDKRVGNAYYVVTPELCEYHVYMEREENGETCIEEDPLIFDENCEFYRKPNLP